jgi:hypothetical protein
MILYIIPKSLKVLKNCWKSRLVFNDEHQNEHGDTYSPTLTLTSEGKEVYIIPPKGTPGIDPDEIWRIKKSINGLKDNNRLFYEYL